MSSFGLYKPYHVLLGGDTTWRKHLKGYTTPISIPWFLSFRTGKENWNRDWNWNWNWAIEVSHGRLKSEIPKPDIMTIFRNTTLICLHSVAIKTAVICTQPDRGISGWTLSQTTTTCDTNKNVLSRLGSLQPAAERIAQLNLPFVSHNSSPPPVQTTGEARPSISHSRSSRKKSSYFDRLFSKSTRSLLGPRQTFTGKISRLLF